MTDRFSAIACPPADEPPAKYSGTFGGHLVTSLACVMNTRSPQTIGVELPDAGSGTFQRTFSSRLQVVGRPVSVECPWPVGPRQAGQFSARAAVAASCDAASNNAAATTPGPPRSRTKRN